MMMRQSILSAGSQPSAARSTTRIATSSNFNAGHSAPQRKETPELSRRRTLEAFGSLIAAMAVSASPALADVEEAVMDSQTPSIAGDLTQYKHLVEPTLAYEFDYPVATSTGRVLPLVFSRRPERYSSAAPLTADARQRIVCELADLLDAVTVSVSVGPPAGTLRTTPPVEWTPTQVAEQVLADRSTARVTSGQRVSLSIVEAATSMEREGTIYYLYEHVSQGSPTLQSTERETYRHAMAVTAVRPGLDGSPFLYTLNLACPEEQWTEIETGFKAAAASFTLAEPGKDYVAPDQDPWRFF